MPCHTKNPKIVDTRRKIHRSRARGFFNGSEKEKKEVSQGVRIIYSTMKCDE
jgi:hypothetical protein